MKKLAIIMLLIGMFFVSSCGSDEDVSPNFQQVEIKEGYSENGNSGGTGGDIPPPGTGG